MQIQSDQNLNEDWTDCSRVEVEDTVSSRKSISAGVVCYTTLLVLHIFSSWWRYWIKFNEH